MATSVRPFLMFQEGKAEAAMKLYASVVPNTEIRKLEKVTNGPGPDGTVAMVLLAIGPQGPLHRQPD